MKKLLLVFLVIASASTAIGQSSGHPLGVTPCEDTLTFGLQALDTDSMYVVKLMPDSYHKSATLFLTRANFIKVNNVWKVDSIIGHTKYFTEIQLHLQSTEGTRRTRKMVFCIAGGKLHTALDIFAVETGHPDGFIDVTKDSALVYDQTLNYNVNINVHSDNKTHTATLFEMRDLHSEKDSKLNNAYKQTYELEFDSEHFVFYDSLVTFKDRYALASPAFTTPKLSIDGKIPSVKLYYAERYYFINGGWYTGIENSTTLNARE